MLPGAAGLRWIGNRSGNSSCSLGIARDRLCPARWISERFKCLMLLVAAKGKQPFAPEASRRRHCLRGSSAPRRDATGHGRVTPDVSAAPAIPFSAPSDDLATQKLAESTFAQVYGRVELSHHGQVGLTKEPLSAPDLSAAVARGRALHSKYVLYGAVDEPGQNPTVRMVAVSGGSLLWSQSYSVANADPAKIAAEVSSKVPSLSD